MWGKKECDTNVPIELDNVSITAIITTVLKMPQLFRFMFTEKDPIEK